MAITIPNLPKIQKEHPEIGEAMKTIQTTINQSVVPVPGNRLAPPTFVKPANNS